MAQQVKIVLLVWCQFVAGHCVRDFRDILELHLVMDRAWRENPAHPGVVFWQWANSIFACVIFIKCLSTSIRLRGLSNTKTVPHPPGGGGLNSQRSTNLASRNSKGRKLQLN